MQEEGDPSGSHEADAEDCDLATENLDHRHSCPLPPLCHR